MFLADWSGRRVAAFAILWLVGFPVVTTAFVFAGAMMSTGSGGFTVGRPSITTPRDVAMRDSLTREEAAWRDSVVRAFRRRDSIAAAGGASADSARAIAFLPTQRSDVFVSIDEHDDGWGHDAGELLPWLLPPALLVAAWTWTRRSRPEPD